MTVGERIVLSVIKEETAAGGLCRYEGLAKRLAAYLDEGEAGILLEASGEADLLDAFLHLLPIQAGVYICVHGLRFGPRQSEPGIAA